MELLDDPDFRTVSLAFPKLGVKIRAAWGTAEFAALMDSLLIDTRERPHAGFPATVFFALAELTNRHTQDFPDLAR